MTFFSLAGLVVGLAGAGLAHILFMPPRSVVVPLLHHSELGSEYIAAAASCDVIYLPVPLPLSAARCKEEFPSVAMDEDRAGRQARHAAYVLSSMSWGMCAKVESCSSAYNNCDYEIPFDTVLPAVEQGYHIAFSHVPLSPSLASSVTQSRGLNLTLDTAPPGYSANGLVFLRIHKTGTSTFGDQIVSRQCASYRIPCDMLWHIDWDWAVKLPYFRDRALVTWIRDPVERVFSEYQYVRNEGVSEQVQWDYTPRQQKLLREADTFEKFLNIPDNPANNRMTRYLLGFARPRNVTCLGECDPAWAEFFNEKLPSPGSQIREAMASGATATSILAVAKHRLNRSISFVGVTDCFDASLAR